MRYGARCKLCIAFEAMLMLTAVGVVLADCSDAEYHCVVWLYTEDGTTLYSTESVNVGQTLTDIGAPGWVAHWVDVSTGYEFPKDKAITKDMILRASTDTPPQDPATHPMDMTLIGLGAIIAILVAFIAFNAVRSYRKG